RLPRAVETPLSALCAWSENPRFIRPGRLEELKRSLEADREMLGARPVVALPDGTVVMGNQRLLAARELGWKTIPVTTIDVDRERASLWALRDNNQYGEWDDEALAEMLQELAGEGVDLALAGFDGAELDRLLSGLEAETDPDTVPPPPEKPDSRPGEIYQLG